LVDLSVSRITQKAVDEFYEVFGSVVGFERVLEALE